MFDAPPIYTEVWTVDETQKDKWDYFLRDNAITMDYLQDVFEKNQAALIEFGPVLAQESQNIIKEPQQKIPYWVWSDDQVDVYMAPNPQVMNHLWVVLKRPVEGLCDVTEDESVAMRAVVQKIQFFLQTHFGTPTFIAQWNQPQSDHFPKRFTTEIIPARSESAKLFDICDKVECNNYLLWRNQFSHFLPLPTQEEVMSTLPFWRSALQDATFSFPISAENEPINVFCVVKTRLAERTKLLRDCIFQVLQQQFTIKREETQEIIESPQIVITGKNTCTFCSEKIIDAEKVFESEFSYILYNYKPFVPGAHFLIFPKRHVQSSEKLREDELRDLHSLACLLIEVLQEKEHRSDVILFTQDDPVLAQSVPHSHTHVILTPSAFRFFVFSMNYVQETTLTREEMEPVLEYFRTKLLEKQTAAFDSEVL
jgi:diadenosine tetraphosphate (Ap4A) HIT family hydrolase